MCLKKIKPNEKAQVFELTLSCDEEPMKNCLENEADYVEGELVDRTKTEAKTIRITKQSTFDSHGRERAQKKAAAVRKRLAWLYQVRAKI